MSLHVMERAAAGAAAGAAIGLASLWGDLLRCGGWPSRVRLVRAPVPGAATICAGLGVLVFSRRLPLRWRLCM